MQNIPKTIYLQIGEDCSTDDGEDFNTLYGVSWCSERINENDIEYVLKEKSEIISDAEVKESARDYWQNGNKLMAVKTVFPFCHSLRKSKEYCEKNFNHN